MWLSPSNHPIHMNQKMKTQKFTSKRKGKKNVEQRAVVIFTSSG